MDNQYKKLKLISVLALIFSCLLFAAMLINITYEALELSFSYSSAPAYTALLAALYYLPFLIAALVFYFSLRKKIRINRQTGNKQPLTKKLLAKRLARLGILAAAVCLLLLILAPFIAMPLYLNHHVSYSGKATPDHPLQDIYKASDFGLSEKQMYLTTEDNYKIWASEISAQNPKAVIIYLSGIIQPSVTYFYGHSGFMKEQGIASILLEVRGHGRSSGNRICLGYEEARDVKAVVEYIRSNPVYDGVPIVIHGVSMGGAAAVNAFGQIKEIDGLIAMSAYSSFEDVTVSTMRSLGVPKVICTLEKPLVSASLSLMFGRKAVTEQKPVRQIQNTAGRPVLLISCSGDTEVPKENMFRLKEANPEVQSWLRDSWEHFIIKNCDFKNAAQDKEYWKKIMDFLKKDIFKC